MNQTYKDANELFAKSSTTYFYSHHFFPKRIRDEITILYAFVRTADNFVDKIPQDIEGFRRFKDTTKRGLQGEIIDNPIIDAFIGLSRRHRLDKNLIFAFLDAMEQDISVSRYNTHEDLNRYMYGSAEVIGLIICKILHLPEQAHIAACTQGRAMQFINFIRDVAEDLRFGRIYIPQEDLRKFHINRIPPITPNEVESFSRLIRYEIYRYRAMQNSAVSGYRFIPWQYRIAVRTAAEMYEWTAQIIEKDPMIIFRKKVKPSRMRVILQALLNGIKIMPLLIRSLYGYSDLYKQKQTAFGKTHR